MKRFSHSSVVMINGLLVYAFTSFKNCRSVWIVRSNGQSVISFKKLIKSNFYAAFLFPHNTPHLSKP